MNELEITGDCYDLKPLHFLKVPYVDNQNNMNNDSSSSPITSIEENTSILHLFDHKREDVLFVRIRNKHTDAHESKSTTHDAPFGIVRHCKSKNTTELILLPYNFPRLLYLLNQLKEYQMKCTADINTTLPSTAATLGASATSHNLFQLTSGLTSTSNIFLPTILREDLISFIKDTPISHINHTYRIYHTHNLQHLLLNEIPSLHNFFIRRFTKIQKAANNELQIIEDNQLYKSNLINKHTVGRDAMVSPPSFISDKDNRRISSILLPPPPWEPFMEEPNESLLSTWERIRRLLYGGSGLTVRGLHVAGVAGTGGFIGDDSVRMNSINKSKVIQNAVDDNDWFLRACGLSSRVPNLPVRTRFLFINKCTMKYDIEMRLK